MQPERKDGSGGEETPQARPTPNTDMQAEDAGTTDSGNAADGGEAAAAESAMKQTSKTSSESGRR